MNTTNDTANYVARYGLSPSEAAVLASHPERRALVVAIEEYRRADGQCLPPGYPLVRGMLVDALHDERHFLTLIRYSDEKMPALTVDAVTEWTWVKSDDHHGKVPRMTRQERRAWSSLSDMPKLAKADRQLLAALTRKLQYRADHDVDGLPLHDRCDLEY
jgi:hypothetical protein